MSMTVGARSCEMNVTPLIDVLLVLLIIFMIARPENHQGVEAQIPQPTPENLQTNPLAPLIIQLVDAGENKQPELKINTERISWDRLEARLRAAYQLREDRIAFVKGDPDIDFEYVAQAVDISHHAGADHVGLLGSK